MHRFYGKLLSLLLSFLLVAGIVSLAEPADIDMSWSSQATANVMQRHMVQSSNGTIVVLYQGGAFPEGIRAKKSADNGATWTDLSGVAGSSTQISSSTFDGYSICIDASDNIYVTYLHHDYDVYFKKLTYNGDGTWTDGSQRTVDAENDNFDPAIIRESNGKIWVTYPHNTASGAQVVATYSTDEFQTPGTRTNVSSPQAGSTEAAYDVAITFRDGNPFIVFQDNIDGAKMKWSCWNGSSWSTPQQILTMISTAGYFSLTSVGTTVHLAVQRSFGNIEYTYYDGTWHAPETLISGDWHQKPSLTTNDVELWCFASIYYPDPNSQYGRYNIKYKRRSGSTWDATWTAITDDNLWNQYCTTPSNVTGDLPFAWTFEPSPKELFTVKFGILTGPPAPTVDDGVSGWSSDNTPTFTWTSPVDPSGIEGYWWAIDDPTPQTGGTWTTGNTATTAPLSDGTHTFYVRARNGNKMIGAAGSHDCQIDATAPGAPTVDDGVSGWSSDNTPTFTWTSPGDTSGITGYWWAVDDPTPETGGTWTTQTAATTTALSDGAHTFYVKARNGSGLIGASGSHDCQIDATAPGAPMNVDDGVSGWSSDNTPTFTWTSPGDTSGITGYWWAVDDPTPETGGTWTTQTAATTTALSDGTHTFYVKARNGSGLIGASGSHVCQIDATAPGAPTVDDGVSGWSSDNTPTFTWTSPGDTSGITGYWWAVDDPTPETGGVWTTGTTTTTVALSDGAHTFYVKARNGSGLIGASGSHDCQIDATAPGAPMNVDDGVSGWSSDNTPTFTWTSPGDTSGITGYWWAVDDATPETGGVWTTATTATTAPLSDGTHTFYVKARNGSGLIGASGSHDCQIDATAPDTSINTYPPNPTSSTSADFTFSANEIRCEFSYRLDGGAWSGYNPATSKSYLGLTPGTHTFEVKAKDGAGNVDATPASYTWVIDTTAPDTFITSYPANPTNSTSATFVYSASESGCEFSYRLDGGAWSGYSGSTTRSYTGLTEGSHTFEVRARDGAGNVDATPASYTWVIDTTAPDTFITSYPANPTNSTSATFEYSASKAGCEFSYRLDGGVWSAYSPATTTSYAGLSGGSHTFEVRARDGAGNVDATPASYTWVIDTTAPDTFITSRPDNPTNSTSADFTFTANESGCEFSYRLDSGGWSGYSSATSASYVGLSGGSHTFEVRARDGAGNVDATPASYTWVIDTTAPDTFITSYPANPTNSTSATFTFSANESGCEFSYRLDGGVWSGYSTVTSVSYAGLTEGSHTFEVRARDGAGNVDATPASYTWVIDTTAPDTFITSYPANPTNSTSATFVYSASKAGCQFSYRLDGGVWSVYSPATTTSYAGLSGGSHTFEVRARDGAGNVDATPASYTWVIDTTAPDTFITSRPDNPTNSTSADFTFTANESGCEFSYRLDSGGWSGYSSATSASYAGLSGGSHTFEVRARDGAGNVDATPASYTWVIDTTAPDTFITSYPANPTNSTSAAFVYSASKAGCEFSYRLDGGDWSGYSGSTTRSYTGLTGGSHTFEVRARDGAGNVDASPASYTWVIDITVPDTFIDSYPSNPTNSTLATFQFSASESGCEFSYKLDSGAWSGYSTATSVSYAGLTEGSHTFEVRARDGAGNVDATPASYTWVIDTTIPDTFITSYPANPTNSTSATFVYSANESGCEFSYRLDGGVWSGYSTVTSVSYAGLTEGSHTFEVRARDGAGNVDASPAFYTWLIDSTVPDTFIDSYPSNPTNSTSATFVYNASKAGCEFSYRLDGGVWSAYSPSTTTSYAGLSGGSHTFEVRARDGAGNVDASPASYTWLIDSTVPDTFIDSYPSNPTNSTSATFQFSASESGCEFSYRLDGGLWSGYSPATTTNYTGLSEGLHTFEVRAKDRVGNVDPTPASYTWRIATTPQVASYRITSTVSSARTIDPFKLIIELIDPLTGQPESGANNPFGLTACMVDFQNAPGKWNTADPLVLNSGRAEIWVTYDTVGTILFGVRDNLGNTPAYTDPIEIRPDGLRYELSAPATVGAGEEFPLTVKLVDTGAGNVVTPAKYARWVTLVAYSSPVGGTLAEGELKEKNVNLQAGIAIVPQGYGLAQKIYVEAFDGGQYNPQSVTLVRVEIEVIGAPKTALRLDGIYNEMNAVLYVRPTTRVIIESVSNIIAETILYRDKAGDWNTYAGPFTLSPGSHSIEYYGIDKYGHKEGINRSKPIYVSFFGSGEVSNRPNPFKAGEEPTLIEYTLKEPSNVIITIYDLFGQEVWHERYEAGENGGRKDNSVPWDGKNLSGKVVANGGYICRVWIENEKRHMVRKIAVAK